MPNFNSIKFINIKHKTFFHHHQKKLNLTTDSLIVVAQYNKSTFSITTQSQFEVEQLKVLPVIFPLRNKHHSTVQQYFFLKKVNPSLHNTQKTYSIY